MATQSLIPPNINYGKLSADEYDPNATYSSGDLRIHDNILYKANQAISVAEPWTPAHWDATTIAAELKAQAGDISDLNSSLSNLDSSKVSLANIGSNNLDDFRSGLHFSYGAILQGRGIGALWEYQYEIGGMYYGAQLYLSYADGLRYRNRSENAWGSWKSIIAP